MYFDHDGGHKNSDEDLELPLFDFTTLANATNGFSMHSKLGEGGFGTVYKVIITLLHLSQKFTQLTKINRDGITFFMLELEIQ